MLKQNRVWLAIFEVFILCVLFNGCDRVDNKDSDFGDGVYDIEANVTKETKTMITDYNQLLQQTKDVESVYQYIENHVKEATPKEADQLILGLFGYLNDVRQVDYERLEDISNSLPDDMKDFLIIMKTETKNPAIIEGKIEISLADLLLRCQTLENHMDTYDEGITFTYAKNLYLEELAAAITGGYDKVNNNQNVYLGVDKVHIDEEAFNEYTKFLEQHKDTRTSDVVESYVNILNENNKVVNENVSAFYASIYETIKEELD